MAKDKPEKSFAHTLKGLVMASEELGAIKADVERFKKWINNDKSSER